MSSLLRKALGAKPRHHLALEEYDDNATGDETVVMKGPLANVYAAALAEVYDKDKVVSGDPAAQSEPSAETGTNVPPEQLEAQPGQALEVTETTNIPEVTAVVLESQAIDAAVTAALYNQGDNNAPKNEVEYATLYAIDQSQLAPANAVEVTQLLADADRPESVSVIIDDVLPADPSVTVTDAEANKTEQMATSLESLVIAMGGKVYRSLPAYVAAQSKKK